MNKLNFDGYRYRFNSTKKFNPINSIQQEQLLNCIDFAAQMTFFKTGEHRAYRTGGQEIRKNGQIFANTLQGKLAEYAIYNQLKAIYPEISKPDLNTYSLGTWDDSDFIIRNKKLAIKSTKHYGELLLLETRDWDNNGNYIPNLSSVNHGYYDYIILVRMDGNIESIMRQNRLLYSSSITNKQFDDLKNSILNSSWNYDIPGFITHEDLVYIIKNEYILPQNAKLGFNTIMDAENYYVQTGDLRNIDLLNI